MLLIFLITGFSFVLALWMAGWVMSKPEGPLQMREVATAIREGAEGFLRTQYAAIARYAFFAACLLFVLYLTRPPIHEDVSTTTHAIIVSFTFSCGAICSALAGYVGMFVSVRANVRTAAAATRSYQEAIDVALRGGAVCGLLVVGLCVGGIASLFTTLQIVFPNLPAPIVASLLVGFGFGASLVALFAQLGGGIYTKAADVGADLVGKVENSIPEDDPRNPAVIADLVGDNVGDCAGRGADLFESISAEIIGAMLLGGALANAQRLPDEVAQRFMMFPLLIHSFDMLVSTCGVLSVKVKKSGNVVLSEQSLQQAAGSKKATSSQFGGDLEGGTDVPLGSPDSPSGGPSDILDRYGGPAGSSAAASALEDPLDVLKRGYAVALALSSVVIVFSTRWLLHTPEHPDAWWKFALCGFLGLCNALTFLQLAQYYTDYAFEPVRRIAAASTTGHGTNIIIGIAVGLESTALPTVCTGASILIAYHLGDWAIPGGGLFGTSVATMGMLSSAVYVLAMDTFGPIADNAGGIVEMSDQPEIVRDITDRLDAVGNVTKAATKGYSIGSAGLACFLLFSAFMDVVQEQSGLPFKVVDFANPEVFVGGLLGGMLVFAFSGLAIQAVGKCAQDVVTEVRAQFAEFPGIMDGSQKPDYNRCVSIVTKAALQEMKKPGLLALGVPISVGFAFRLIGSLQHKPLLGPTVLAGFLMVATITGILLSLFLNNAGGAWDNAKKYIETGKYGGKGSEAHKAAVTGDTVGDPFKDTAGPSLHVLIKLLATVSLVLGPLFISTRHHVGGV
jgi:Na+/H+-translocating membrane pyrophosphatase